MSKYTSELRFICENTFVRNETYGHGKKYELNSSGRVINDEGVIVPTYEIVNNKYVQRFIFSWLPTSQNDPLGNLGEYVYPFFDENYRKTLQEKILLTYYTREICEETVGLWKLRLLSKMQNIMPYYNQLYSETFEKYGINPFFTVDLHDNVTEDRANNSLDNRTGDNTVTNTGSEASSSSGNEHYSRDLSDTMSGGHTDDRNNTRLFSDTPQGATVNLAGGYLTNVTKDEGDVTRTYQNEKNEAKGTTETINNAQNLIVRDLTNGTIYNDKLTRQANENLLRAREIVGKQAGVSYSKLLKEFRETFLNIDLQIINECKDLFFGLWE